MHIGPLREGEPTAVHKIYDIVSYEPYFELLCGCVQKWVVISSPPQLTTDLQSYSRS